MIDILCNFQRISWKPRIIGRQQTKVCWWPSERKPPVPIPNTVVKTLSGENTWRATSWEDSSLPASKLNKSENWWISIFAFFLKKTILAEKPPASRKTWHLSWPIRNKRVYVFCYRVFNSLQKHSALCSQVARTLARRRLAEFSSLFHDHKQTSWYLKVSALLFKIRKRRDSNSRCRLPHTTP